MTVLSFAPVLGLLSVLDVAFGAVIQSPSMPTSISYDILKMSMVTPSTTLCTHDMTMSILPMPNSTVGLSASAPYILMYTTSTPTVIIPPRARSDTPKVVVPPIGGSPQILTNLTHVMGVRIAALQPHDTSGKSQKLFEMCSKMSMDDCARLKDTFPGSANNNTDFPGFECPVLHQALCQNGNFSNSASVVSEIQASLSYIFAIQLQAGAGLWEGHNDFTGHPSSEGFVKFNAFVCQHLRQQNIEAMGMDPKIVTDAICASGQTVNLFEFAYGSISPGMKDAIDQDSTILLGYEYQLLGKEDDVATFPLRCNSTVYSALDQQGLGNNHAEFDKYYCQPAWSFPRLSAVKGEELITKTMTSLFINQSKAALWGDRADINTSTFRFLCDNVDADVLSIGNVNGALVKQAWCEIATDV